MQVKPFHMLEYSTVKSQQLLLHGSKNIGTYCNRFKLSQADVPSENKHLLSKSQMPSEVYTCVAQHILYKITS